MLTKTHNFSLVQGQKSRMVIILPEGTDAYDYEVYAGNNQCPCAHMSYEVESIIGNRITMLSEPAPDCITLPYQLFIRDKSTNVEWLVVAGNISVVKRCIGQSSTNAQEIPAPINEELNVYTVEITYNKHDLDEAVRIARTSAIAALQAASDAGSAAREIIGYIGCAKTWAIGEPSEPEEGSSKYWAGVSQSYAWDLGTAVNQAKQAACDARGAADTATCAVSSACGFANDAKEYKEAACNYSVQACQYKNEAAQASNAACTAREATCTAAGTVCGLVSTVAGYKNAACTAAGNASDWAACACRHAGNAQDAQNYACSAASSAAIQATNASNYATCSYNWSQEASSAKTVSCCNARKTVADKTTTNSYKNQASSYKDQACSAARVACRVADHVPTIEYLKPTDGCTHQIKGSTLIVLCADGHTPGLPYDIKNRFCLMPGATGEIMLDYGTETFYGDSIIFPESWRWIENTNEAAPTFEKGRIYRLVVRDDANPCDHEIKPIANVAYDYPRNK